MLNFCEVLAGHDKVTDADRATKCGLKFKDPSLQSKVTKIEIRFENIGFNGKTV